MVAAGVSRHDRAWPAGMMGNAAAVDDRLGPMMNGAGGMMNGLGSGNTGAPIETSQEAAQRVDGWLGASGYDGFQVEEVMAFTNGYYLAIEDPDGNGAFELLLDPASGALWLEPGPNMMWNTSYGMMGGRPGSAMMGQGMWQGMMGGAQAAGAGPVTAAQAQSVAQGWLDEFAPGETARAPRAFPGYFTLDTARDGVTVGMLSVNASTGAVWYHGWHGRFLDELEL